MQPFFSNERSIVAPGIHIKSKKRRTFSRNKEKKEIARN
jgi:hypothetical protein